MLARPPPRFRSPPSPPPSPLAAALVCALAATGCSVIEKATGGGSQSAPLYVAGRVFLGNFSAAQVTFYTYAPTGGNAGVLLAGMTSATGDFALSTVVPSADTCLLARVVGGAYVDPATGGEVSLGPGDQLESVYCPDTSPAWLLAISPLSSMVVARADALAIAGVPADEAVELASVAVAQQLGLPSVLGVLPADPASAAAVRTASRWERQYGLAVGGLAQLARTLGVRAIDLAEALAADARDGRLDGRDGAAAIDVPKLGGGTVALDADAGTQGLADGLAAMAGGERDQTHVPAPVVVTRPLPLGDATPDVLRVTTAALPAWRTGDDGELELGSSGGVAPRRWTVTEGALPAWLTLSDDGELSGTAPALADDDTLAVSAPFTVTVTDSALPPATASAQLTVSVEAEAPEVETVERVDAELNEPVNALVVRATGDHGPYYFALGAGGGFPPLGLGLGADGVLSGTPTVAGEFSFAACAVDLVGSTACSASAIAVNVVDPNAATGGPCDGGWYGSTLICAPQRVGGTCACQGAPSYCVTETEFASLGLPLPAACGPEGTTSCLAANGVLVQPCCPGLTCVATASCGATASGLSTCVAR